MATIKKKKTSKMGVGVGGVIKRTIANLKHLPLAKELKYIKCDSIQQSLRFFKTIIIKQKGEKRKK